MSDSVRDPAGSAGAPNQQTTLFGDIKSLLDHFFDILTNQLRIATLESRLALKAIIAVLVGAVCLSFAALSLLIGLQGLAWLYLQRNGVDALEALAALCAFNLVLIVFLLVFIRLKFKFLAFKATLRALSPAPPAAARAAQYRAGMAVKPESSTTGAP